MASYVLDLHVNKAGISQSLNQRSFAVGIPIKNLAERNDVVGERSGAKFLQRKPAVVGLVLAVPDEMTVSCNKVNVLEFSFANGLQEAREFSAKPANLAVGFALERMPRELHVVILSGPSAGVGFTGGSRSPVFAPALELPLRPACGQAIGDRFRIFRTGSFARLSPAVYS